MESLNLNNLATSLPSSSYASAENELSKNFKAAAFSLTALYRSSRRTSARAYNAGYAAACSDLLAMVQQSVSAPDAPASVAGPGVTVARIMDYIDARLAAIKAREEEEDEEEERTAAKPSGPAPKAATVSPKPVVREVQPAPVAPPTPYTPDSSPAPAPPRFSAPAPSLPLPIHAQSPTPQPQPFRALPLAHTLKGKSRLVTSANPKDFAFEPPAMASIIPFPTEPATKRRREAAEGVAEPGTSRRRTRSQLSHRNGGANVSERSNPPAEGAEAMDVEEDGPARKRVARR